MVIDGEVVWGVGEGVGGRNRGDTATGYDVGPHGQALSNARVPRNHTGSSGRSIWF